MRILVDIGHPAHVHYFKHAIAIWKAHGHEVIITARDRNHIADLLKDQGLEFTNRGKGSDSKLGKLMYMAYADLLLLGVVLRKWPDIYISFSSPYAAQISWLFRKPHICLNDTEHTDRSHSIFTYPFSSTILTPKCYKNDLGPKHYKLNSVIEGLYLSNGRFVPDTEVIRKLRGPEDQDYVLVRFVSWKAHHDYGQSGMSDQVKRDLIDLLKTRYKVYVSAEGDIPQEYRGMEIKIEVSQMHDAIAGAQMFVGESGTMASESAFLGVPALYINSLPLMGYLAMEQEHGLLKHFRKSDGIVEFLRSWMDDPDLKTRAEDNAAKLRGSFNDPTDVLVKLVENYPEELKNLR